jgi:hypothetical protein
MPGSGQHLPLHPPCLVLTHSIHPLVAPRRRSHGAARASVAQVAVVASQGQSAGVAVAVVARATGATVADVAVARRGGIHGLDRVLFTILWSDLVTLRSFRVTWRTLLLMPTAGT